MSSPEIKLRVVSADDAARLVAAAMQALDALEPLVEAETMALRAGMVRDALGLTEAKSEAARSYLELIEAIRSNAIALGRFRPPGLDLLKRRHARFSDVLSLNAAVLTTARTVSESILREVSNEITGNLNPQGYGARGKATSAYTGQARPIAVSRSL